MNIIKAVITAAGRHQRTLPLQLLIDRDGEQKAVLRIIVEEVLGAGIDEIGVVVAPGDQDAYRAACGELANRLHFIEQAAPRGYGHAVLCAADFTASEPFLLLVGDHLYVSSEARSCAQQLVQAARQHECAVSAVQPSRESLLPYYGAVGGRLMDVSNALYQVERVLEKPTPTAAEQELVVPGMRAGHYLCFFGMHVLTPSVMAILREQLTRLSSDERLELSPALDELARRERYLALQIHGWRYDVGVKYGLMLTQLALSLAGKERERVLAQLVELLATRQLAQGER
ncbi:MAG: UTP--glucose-1-phosphate uridylyltransferase [Chloroflexi bacterium]|nr:UTP--glucose-1-phosphate uridylyltransferase [Chloroflexota bacterium]